MARLLEGDVGSGKTVVAASAALAVAKSGYQVAFMAPTEILARQHFEEFTRRLQPFRLPIGMLVSAEAKKFPSKVNPKEATHISKKQLLDWVAGGEIKILVGTHALIQDKVQFKNLGFVVVDEQHRFGTEQRHRMLTKNKNKKPLPHFLSMTATPIPRTLALTLYGNLDLSVIDQMPPGRKPTKTRIVPPKERTQTYAFIEREIARGGQAFVVCPRIEEKKDDGSTKKRKTRVSFDWSDVKSVKAEYKKLKEEIFPERSVGMIHGKITPKEKEKTMQEFRDKKIDILVSTSVIEVGVDIPNASIMMIEGGERFGLAQLHQLRGRVGRRGQESFCFVFTTEESHTEMRRLKALESVHSGFELAEYDLAFRGPGDLAGRKQWGLSDVAMDALKNMKMVEAAHNEAERLIKEDLELTTYPLLQQKMSQMQMLHFE